MSVICRDSLAVLLNIQSGKSKIRPDILTEILMAICNIYNIGCSVEFMWVPAHAGIQAKAADKAAKKAIEKHHVEVNITLRTNEICSVIHKGILQSWQKSRDGDHKGRHICTIHGLQKMFLERGRMRLS